MTKPLGLACVLLLALSAEAAARCSVPRITTFENQTVDGHMQADSGRPCRIRFLSSSGPMSGVDIVQRPSHGTVQVGDKAELDKVLSELVKQNIHLLLVGVGGPAQIS